MTQAVVTQPVAEQQTCTDCPHFKDFQEVNGRGWCKLFDQYAREHHEQTQDCINSSDTVTSHELEENLEFFPNLNSEAFPTEEIIDEANLPHTEYQVGSVVKVIDSDEYYTEWGVFEVIDRMTNAKRSGLQSRHCTYVLYQSLYRNTESYLDEVSWYFRLSSHDDASTISESLWIREDEICHFEQSHLICTKDIF